MSKKYTVGSMCGYNKKIKIIDTITDQNNEKIGWKCLCFCGETYEVALLNAWQTKGCKNPEHDGFKQSGRTRRRYKETTVANCYRAHVSTAKKKDIDPLSKESWLSIVSLSCNYCGKIDVKTALNGCSRSVSPNVTQEERSKYEVKMNGVDRLNSDLGYILDNVVPCCRSCNLLKKAIPFNEFMDKLFKIDANVKDLKQRAGKEFEINKFQKTVICNAYYNHVGNCAFPTKKRNPLSLNKWKKVVFLPCEYCGETDTRYLTPSAAKRFPEWPNYKKEFSAVKMNGVDRIDSAMGYVDGNIVSCCHLCNHMKGILSVADFKQIARQIVSKTLLDEICIQNLDPV